MYLVTQLIHGLAVMDFSALYQDAFREAVALILKLKRSHVTITAFRNIDSSSSVQSQYLLESASQLQVDYTLMYLTIASTPLATAIAAALTQNNNGTTVASNFKALLLKNAAGNLTLQAKINSISISPPVVIELTRAPTSKPSAALQRLPSPQSSTDTSTILMYVFGLGVGSLLVLSGAFYLLYRLRWSSRGVTRAAVPYALDDKDIVFDYA